MLSDENINQESTSNETDRTNWFFYFFPTQRFFILKSFREIWFDFILCSPHWFLCFLCALEPFDSDSQLQGEMNSDALLLWYKANPRVRLLRHSLSAFLFFTFYSCACSCFFLIKCFPWIPHNDQPEPALIYRNRPAAVVCCPSSAGTRWTRLWSCWKMSWYSFCHVTFLSLVKQRWFPKVQTVSFMWNILVNLSTLLFCFFSTNLSFLTVKLVNLFFF